MISRDTSRLYFLILLCYFTSAADIKEVKAPRVCVIGAGVAGLTSAFHLKNEGINFTVFEATQYVGGTWRYDPRTGTDENGLPSFTSMYKNLRANLPKPVMELSGFPAPNNWPSFPSWRLVYDYLKSYAKHHDLEKHIKFLCLVTLVTRIDDIWRVVYRHAKTGEVYIEEYDFVFVGTGRSKPNLPDIPGAELFQGKIIHSHSYKEPDIYKDRRMLIIGSGPSGIDIGMELANLSKIVIHSQHRRFFNSTPYPSNYIKKPDVKRFNETGVIFVDDSYEDVDDIIYCTGYQYDFPFLDETSKLNVAPKVVTPLYQHMVNINQPTMVLLGLVQRACFVILSEAQSRYAVSLVKGNFSLPSKEEMEDQLQQHVANVTGSRLPLSKIHELSLKEDKYYEDLTAESGIYRVPPVFFKIRMNVIKNILNNLYTYRDYAYTVIDNETFRVEKETKDGNTYNGTRSSHIFLFPTTFIHVVLWICLIVTTF